MNSPPVDVFQQSTNTWFRARTYHEYGTIRAALRSQVDFDRARILDFGCGALGLSAASFALRHPGATVFGTDLMPYNRAKLQSVLSTEVGMDVPANLHVFQVAPNSLVPEVENLDLVYSWSVFEHIPADDLRRNFALIRERLAPGGVFYFQIGGLYFHTSGSHLKHLFPDLPWHHLVLSLDELRRRVFATDRDVAANEREWQQFMELNRQTAEDYLDAAEDAGLVLKSKQLMQQGEPPVSLLRSYSASALTTFEIRATFTAS